MAECQGQPREKIGMQWAQVRILRQFNPAGKIGQQGMIRLPEPSSKSEYGLPAQRFIRFKVKHVFDPFQPDVVSGAGAPLEIFI